MAVLGQGRLTQSRPARSQPPCLVPSRLIPTINKHTVLVHVNRLHSGGELSLRGALLHLGIDSVPSTYISGLTPLARPEQIPPESTERNTILKTRSVLDVMRGYMSLFAPGRQLAKSALHQLIDGWKGPGSPGLNQGQHPALTSAPCKAEDAPKHPPRQPPMESDHTSVWSPDSHHLPQARHEASHTEHHKAQQ